MIGGKGSAVELGGFPGEFSVYLRKYYGLEVTLIDYYIKPDVIAGILAANGLQTDEITVVEADVTSYTPNLTFDLVCSFGLLEHFADLDVALWYHVKFVRPGGIVLMTLPNFRGINGFLQYVFDRKNLWSHNLGIMDLAVLKKALLNVGMTDVCVEYYPSSQVWLEDLRRRYFGTRVVVRLVNEILTHVSKVVDPRSRWLSNSIVVIARRPPL